MRIPATHSRTASTRLDTRGPDNGLARGRSMWKGKMEAKPRRAHAARCQGLQKLRKNWKLVDKPGSVGAFIKNTLAAIPLGRALLRGSSDRPGSGAGRAFYFPIWSCSGWGLPCQFCCQSCGRLLPCRFTLAWSPETGAIGGLFSVALSVALGLERLTAPGG